MKDRVVLLIGAAAFLLVAVWFLTRPLPELPERCYEPPYPCNVHNVNPFIAIMATVTAVGLILMAWWPSKEGR